MGRKKLIQNLEVYLGRNRIGALQKRANGSIEFRYDDTWVETGYPISLSMPLSDRFFTGAQASYYFDNLLPDNRRVLEAIATKFEAPSTDSFDLLYAIGRECVGALSFFDAEESPVFLEKMQVRAIDSEAIAHRLRGLASDNPLGMDQGDFRLSIAGAQEKMALLWRKGRWWEPRGPTPTSHILKRSIGALFRGTTTEEIDFSRSVDNEWICLKLANACGIKSAHASIETFVDQRVLSVERFDRQWSKELLIRIPQEDFCQATHTAPTLKYERKGGPSLFRMMEILAHSNNAAADRKMFFKAALFNDLIYNADGHAKNFSLFHTRKGFALTPIYDLLSAHFLNATHPERYAKLRFSLFVNGKENLHEITPSDWQKEALRCGLKPAELDDIRHELSLVIPQLSIPPADCPADLDQTQLNLILKGMRKRAKITLA